MSDRNAATALRILGPCARLLGPGDGDSLQNINTEDLPNGSSCWVVASRAEFRLYKDDDSTPPDGTNVIKPASGPGRWFIQTATGVASVQVENVRGALSPVRTLLQTEGLHPVDTGTAIALVDGEVDALAWPSLSAAAAANPGRTLVLINGAHTVDADLLDATVTLKFRQGTILNIPASRTIPRVDMSQGGIIVVAAGATVTHSGPILAPDTARVWDLSAAGSSVHVNPGSVAWLHAEWFGVSPAAIAADNVSRLNAAIATASAGGIGLIEFGGGTFDFDGQINWLNGTSFLGAGWGSKFFSLGPDTGTVLRYTGSSVFLNMSGVGGASNQQIEKCELLNLTVEGPGKTTAGSVGVKIWHTRNATLRNVYIEGFEQGVWTGRNANSDINYGTMFDVVFINQCVWGFNGDADLSDPAHPIAGTSGALAFCEFLGCTVRNCGNAGIGAAYVGAFCARWIGGFMGGNACTGIWLLGAQNCMISPDIENCGYKGTISAVTPGGTAPPVATLTGVPLGTWAANSLVIECQLGGAAGVATYRFSTDGGLNWSNDITTDPTPGTALALIDPGASALVGVNGKTGLYLAFAAGPFDADNVWAASTTEGGSYDIWVTDTLGNGLGANSQGVTIIGGGCANSSTSFGRRGGIKIENCDNYEIIGTQIATASGRDSSSFVGVEIASSAKGRVGPGHYEGFSGSKTKIVYPVSNNTVQDESSNYLTKMTRLGAAADIGWQSLVTGEAIPRLKWLVGGELQWADDAQLYEDTTQGVLTYKDPGGVARVLSVPLAMPIIGGTVLDFDADRGITGSAGTLTWLDQSGNAFNGAAFAGSTGLSSAPDAAFNGHTVLTFNGTDDGVTADAAAAAFSGTGKPFYAITVCQLVTSAALASFWSFGKSGNVRPLFAAQNNAASNWRIQRRNDANTLVTSTGGSAPDTALPHVIEVLWDPTTAEVSLWVDGVVKINGDVSASDPVTFDLCTLGLLRVQGSTTEFCHYKLARQQFYKRIPTTLERTALRQFFQYMYGTP